ncbi:MAG: hypothetical protein AAGD12_10525, partial [Pseudomonadota bacterium]
MAAQMGEAGFDLGEMDEAPLEPVLEAEPALTGEEVEPPAEALGADPAEVATDSPDPAAPPA